MSSGPSEKPERGDPSAPVEASTLVRFSPTRPPTTAGGASTTAATRSQRSETSGRRMQIPICHLDVFADRVFRGVPAVVCPLDGWLPDDILADIAGEHAKAETVFLVGTAGVYEVRWFSRAAEVPLSAPGALAAAHTVFHYLEPQLRRVQLLTPSGMIMGQRDTSSVLVDLPLRPPVKMLGRVDLTAALGGITPETVMMLDSSCYVAVLADEAAVEAVRIDRAAMDTLGRPVVVLTSPGDQSDFTARVVAAKWGPEALAVRSSALCTLLPYWRQRLDRDDLTVRVVGQRGGSAWCSSGRDRAVVAALGQRYMEGIIYL
ncbi:MAG: hypothetical protein CMO28_28010 [Tistrella sp.]|nr:hypothetical protein [Tistrella sp.]